MFELEDHSSGYHDGFLNKYADNCGPKLDAFLSDSLQDVLDIDIRSEIATVVGSHSDFGSDLSPSFEHALDTISSMNNLSSNLHSYSGLPGSYSSWLSGNCGSSSWSSSHDYFADVGACVNPISVMPLISSSLLHKSPKTNLNANGHQRSANSPAPASPNVNETKSHLTFSPVQVKVSAGALRNEQLLSHIPKQIVAISSSVTAATTAPATLATNSALQRKNNSAVESIKKDLGTELRKISVTNGDESKSLNSSNGSSLLHNNNNNNNSLLNGSTTNTIKLAPGIGGLTFANSITYNKLKQQSAAKSPQGSPVTSNGTIVLKRDRDSSPLHNMATLNGGSNGTQHVTKLLGRSVVQAGSSFTPKSIASVHSPLMQNGGGSIGSPSSSSSSSSVSSQSSPSTSLTHSGSFSAGLIPITMNNSQAVSTNTSNGNTTITSIAVKSLQQKIKVAPVESEYPKPAYSYSCLIAMALKNSRSGSLPVSEIYSFMCEHFPYFRTAPSGWKNSVRHNLSLNKCFEKIEKPATNGSQRKGCLWAMNPERITKMDEEVLKWSRKDPSAIRNAMVYPDNLEALERGEMKHGSTGDSDVELDSQSEIEETSDLEEHELDDTIVDNMFVEEDIEEDEMLSNGILMNGSDGISEGGDGNSCGGMNGNLEGEEVDVNMLQQQQSRDFDIEVEDIYDAIDIEDDKEQTRMTINQSDIIELSPADLNISAQPNSSGYQSPKRARLNINYSIGPAGELEKQIQQHQQQTQHQQHQQQQQQQQQSIKQFKLHAQPQHIVVQTITNSNGTTSIQTVNGSSIAGHHNTSHYQQINAVLPNQNRRKMQLVNRIV